MLNCNNFVLIQQWDNVYGRAVVRVYSHVSIVLLHGSGLLKAAVFRFVISFSVHCPEPLLKLYYRFPIHLPMGNEASHSSLRLDSIAETSGQSRPCLFIGVLSVLSNFPEDLQCWCIEGQAQVLDLLKITSPLVHFCVSQSTSGGYGATSYPGKAWPAVQANSAS